ncbi:MAG: hypothetical protein JNL83_00025 [Myxococcales bacterium]|nr:hypothetical protein [Myxococcales bacterium]
MLDALRAYLLLFLAACSADPDHAPARTFDPCVATSIAAPDASTEQSASLDRAIGHWRDVGIAAFARSPHPEIAVVFRDAPQAFYGFYDDDGAIVYVNERLNSEAASAVTIAHELGHALGLPHVPASVRASVMNMGNVSVPPTPEDAAELARLWGECSTLPQERAASRSL